MTIKLRELGLLVLLSLFLLVGCSSDDEGDSPDADVTINGVAYNFTTGTATDHDEFFHDTHYEYGFVIADGPIAVAAEPGFLYGFNFEGTIGISIDVNSFGDSLELGVYTFDESTLDPPSFSFFDMTVFLDNNADGSVDQLLRCTSGTIEITGTSPNFTITSDVILNNNEHLTFTYNNGFEYIDNRP